MIWGFYTELCVADRVSTYVDAVYNNYMEHSGVSLLLATFSLPSRFIVILPGIL